LEELAGCLEPAGLAGKIVAARICQDIGASARRVLDDIVPTAMMIAALLIQVVGIGVATVGSEHMAKAKIAASWYG
jgi:hypothetical protein